MNVMIRQATPNDYRQISELFVKNYDNYHYPEFANHQAIAQIFSKGFVGWVALDDSVVVGFAGLYKKENELIKLAHLLVDKEYRGLHVGKALEDERQKYYTHRNGSLVIASCVETPLYSFLMKSKLGFQCLGVKINYRPNSIGSGNSILMGKYNKDIPPQKIESPSVLTTSLITEVCKRLGCLRHYTLSQKFPRDTYILDAGYRERKTAYVQGSSDLEGYSLFEVISKLKKSNCNYVSLRANALNDGFGITDEILIDNGFYPVLYVPNYSQKEDLVEYQYMGIAEKQKYNSLISKLKEQMIDENSIGLPPF